MTIHTIGDSHSQCGWENVTNIHLSNCLCFSFGRDKLNRFDIRNYNIKNGDTIIFCLGEIDCRCQVHKYVNEITTYQEVIDNIIINYFEAIKINIDNLKVRIRVCVYNVVPPVEKYNTAEYVEWPFLGSDEERKKYVLYFNKKLEEKCIEYNYLFFDVYDKYIDNNGFLLKNLSDGGTHINDGKYINEFIKKYNL
jgi:hypothetical protein